MRRLFFFLFLLAAAPSLAQAAPLAPYSPEAYNSALKEGKTIVLDFHAEWCSTCRAQAKVLAELSTIGVTAAAIYLVVDFDKNKEMVKKHKVLYQSTMIVLRGDAEIARSIGETDPGALLALIELGL